MEFDNSDEFSSFIARLHANRSINEKCPDPLLRIAHFKADPQHEDKLVQLDLPAIPDAAALTTWLGQDDRGGEPVLTIYAISAPRSRAPLGICGHILRDIMEAHDISPQALDIASCIYATVRNSESGYCAPFTRLKRGEIQEYSYTAKYVEHSASLKSNDMRIRQTGVYHQYNESTKQGVVILLSPHTSSLLERSLLQQIYTMSTRSACQVFHSWLDIELLRLYMPAWRSYARHHDTALQIMIEKLIGVRAHKNSSVDPAALDEAASIENAMLPTEPIFSSLSSSIAKLQEIYGQFSSTGAMQTISYFDIELSNQRAIVLANEENARFLLKKHASFLQLFDKTLAYKQQIIMLDDSSTIKSITIITLIYLAFSVVGTVMSMPIFHLDEETESLQVSPDIWIYFAVSVPLTLISVSIWLAFSRLRNRVMTSPWFKKRRANRTILTLPKMTSWNRKQRSTDMV